MFLDCLDSLTAGRKHQAQDYTGQKQRLPVLTPRFRCAMSQDWRAGNHIPGRQGRGHSLPAPVLERPPPPPAHEAGSAAGRHWPGLALSAPTCPGLGKACVVPKRWAFHKPEP